MSTPSKAKGTAAEREVVKYLREYWPAAERRALSGSRDRGDIAGIPDTVGEVKAAAKIELVKWQRETLTEMKNAKADHCFLVAKRPRKPVAQWDFYIPAYMACLGPVPKNPYAIEEWEWLRMDFRLGRDVLREIQSFLR